MKQIKIISDGTSFNTKVLNHDGTEIEGITSVTIDPITINSLVTVSMTFINVALEIQADWNSDCNVLKHWANKKTGKTA